MLQKSWVGGVGWGGVGWVVLPIIVSLQSSLELEFGVWILSFELDWTSTGLSLDNISAGDDTELFRCGMYELCMYDLVIVIFKSHLGR